LPTNNKVIQPEKRNKLTAKIAQMKNSPRKTEARAERWLELIKEIFSFAIYTQSAFLKTTKMGKTELEQKKILPALN